MQPDVSTHQKLEMESPLNRSINNFASDVYGVFVRKQRDGQTLVNTFLSPASIYTALTMTMAGADGKTKDQMLETLRIPEGLQKTDPHSSIGSLLQECFTSTPGVELSLANRLFCLQPATIVPQFSKTLQEHYKSDTEIITSMHNEAKRVHINGWVSGKTMKKIKALLPPGSVTDDTLLTLINAIYFKGKWEHLFDKAKTKRHEFHLLNGKTTQLSFMHKIHSYRVGCTELEDTIIRLPFEDPKWEMVVIVPTKVDGLSTLLDDLINPGQLEKTLAFPCYEQHVELFMPKFKLTECETLQLAPVLKELGMTELFGPADLSPMCSSHELFVSDVLHKAILEVDEKGAVAAAATAVNFNKCSLQYRSRPTMIRVDRPFFVTIVYNANLPIFMGHVTIPGN